MKNIALIIPVYNEEKYVKTLIENLLKEIKKTPEIKKIIFVNDGSKDKTKQIITSYTPHRIVSIINNIENQGKGGAMKTGLSKALKDNVDAVIFMDGDCQHSPYYLPLFTQSLDNFSIVFGYRNPVQDAPYFRRLGNKIAIFIFRHFFRIKRKDLLCGYMGIRKDLFKDLNWKSNDYGVEAEISAIIGKKQIRFEEILIDTIYLDKNKGVSLTNAFFILLKIPFWYFQY